MRSKDKKDIRRFERYWEKQGRQDMFTWVHRYLRLHRELLEDSAYQSLYDFHRATLILYLRKDLNDNKTDDAKLGELIDVLADIFNRNEAERVNKYKPVVDELYKVWKENPKLLNNIRITT